MAQRTTLLIADISGYTRFMAEHRFALPHAQKMVAVLLESVIDSAKGFKVAKLEGDAAFLHAPFKEGTADLGNKLEKIRHAFLQTREYLLSNNLCSCKGCEDVGQLKLKFVAHVGDVEVQRVKRFTELAGMDVILVHRMLKNDVPLKEYVLVTDAALPQLSPSLASAASPLVHDFEGLGPTNTHFVDLTPLGVPTAPPRRLPWAVRMLRTVGIAAGSVPYWVGLQEPCVHFRNVESARA